MVENHYAFCYFFQKSYASYNSWYYLCIPEKKPYHRIWLHNRGSLSDWLHHSSLPWRLLSCVLWPCCCLEAPWCTILRQKKKLWNGVPVGKSEWPPVQARTQGYPNIKNDVPILFLLNNQRIYVQAWEESIESSMPNLLWYVAMCLLPAYCHWTFLQLNITLQTTELIACRAVKHGQHYSSLHLVLCCIL